MRRPIEVIVRALELGGADCVDAADYILHAYGGVSLRDEVGQLLDGIRVLAFRQQRGDVIKLCEAAALVLCLGGLALGFDRAVPQMGYQHPALYDGRRRSGASQDPVQEQQPYKDHDQPCQVHGNPLCVVVQNASPGGQTAWPHWRVNTQRHVMTNPVAAMVCFSIRGWSCKPPPSRRACGREDPSGVY